jgi:hypothetical protein
MNLHAWAIRWGVGQAALEDLRREMGQEPPPAPPAAKGRSEAWAQSAVRLEASQKGLRLWRNNTGALLDARGVPVRYGLANDSAAVNARLKSADLIGIRPVVVGPEHLGRTLGVFLSREMKAPGWRYTGTPHEQAQLAWAELITSLGGDAGFATGPGTL